MSTSTFNLDCAFGRFTCLIWLNAHAALERVIWVAYGWPELPEETEHETISTLAIGVVTVLPAWPLASWMNDTFISRRDPFFRAWAIAWDWHVRSTDSRAIFDANLFYP